MSRLRYLTGAKADLTEIHTYITGISGNADAGRQSVARIQKNAQTELPYRERWGVPDRNICQICAASHSADM